MIPTPKSSDNFLECVSGFLFQPRARSEEFFAGISVQKRVRLINRSMFIPQFLGIFTGLVLIFYFFYPEAFLVPGSLTGGPSLFIFSAANPLYMVGGFLLGYIGVAFLSPYLSSGLNFFVLRAIAKRSAPLKSLSPTLNQSLPVQNHLGFSVYVRAYSFSLLPVGIFDIFAVFWIYFYEKFLYSKIYFPVADITLGVVILITMVGITLVWKFWIEFGINRAFFHASNRVSIVPILVKVGILVVLLGVVAFLMNSIAGQFA